MMQQSRRDIGQAVENQNELLFDVIKRLVNKIIFFFFIKIVLENLHILRILYHDKEQIFFSINYYFAKMKVNLLTAKCDMHEIKTPSSTMSKSEQQMLQTEK